VKVSEYTASWTAVRSANNRKPSIAGRLKAKKPSIAGRLGALADAPPGPLSRPAIEGFEDLSGTRLVNSMRQSIPIDF
jgi:hypothetical protein